MLKIGDKVRLITRRHGIGLNNPYYPVLSIEGIIIGVDRIRNFLPFSVRWNNGQENSYEEEDLKKIVIMSNKKLNRL